MEAIKTSIVIDPVGIFWGIFIGGITICSVVIVMVVHKLCGGSVSGRYQFTRFPQTDFRESNHLAFGNTPRWDLCGNSLLDHAPFTPESI